MSEQTSEIRVAIAEDQVKRRDAELKRLRCDGERLDWLERHWSRFRWNPKFRYLREAIGQAMAEE